MMRTHVEEPASGALRQTYDLPGGASATFTFTAPDQVGFERTLPAKLSSFEEFAAFLRAYVAARRQFLEAVRALTGLRIAVVDELPGGHQTVELPPIARTAKG
jgi:hypothetical protein